MKRRPKPAIEFVDVSMEADELEQLAREAATRAVKLERDAARMRRFQQEAN